jgi:hypothetical protein
MCQGQKETVRNSMHISTKQGSDTPAKSTPIFYPSIPKKKFEGRNFSTYITWYLSI